MRRSGRAIDRAIPHASLWRRASLWRCIAPWRCASLRQRAALSPGAAVWRGAALWRSAAALAAGLALVLTPSIAAPAASTGSDFPSLSRFTAVKARYPALFSPSDGSRLMPLGRELTRAVWTKQLADRGQWHPELCVYWAERLVKHRDDAGATVVRQIASLERAATLDAAVAAARQLREDATNAAYHPSLSAAQRARLLRIAVPEEREHLVGALVCEIGNAAATSNRDGSVRAMTHVADDARRRADAAAGELTSTLTLSRDLRRAVWEKSALPALGQLGAVYLESQTTRERAMVLAFADVFAPGRSPAAAMRADGFRRFVDAVAAEASAAMAVLETPHVARIADFDIILNAASPAFTLRAGLVRAERGADRFAEFALGLLARLYVDEYLRDASVRDRLGHTAKRIQASVEERWKGGNGRLYAAVPPGADWVHAWREAGWARWQFMTPAEFERAKAAGLVKSERGGYWMAPEHPVRRRITEGNRYAAARAYAEAIQAAPWWPLPYRNLALVYSALGNEQRAIDTMSRFLELEPAGHVPADAKARIAEWGRRRAAFVQRGGRYDPVSGLAITPDREDW